MSKQERLEKAVKIAGTIFKSEFQYPKVQKGRYNVVNSKLEKAKWAYRHWFNQLEVAEKGSGLEEYFRNQDLSFKLPKGFKIENTASISSAGDLLAVDVLVPENTKYIFDDIVEFYGSADLVCANLESPVDMDKPIGRTQVFGQPAQMNTSRGMLERFINEGKINCFSTANNHSIDWGKEGLLATIEELENAGVYFSGTNRSTEEQEDVKIIDLNGIKVAMLAYTMDLNGRSVPKGKEYLVNEVRFNDEVCDISLIKRHVKKAKEKGADKIIACCHWGWEFEMYPHKNVVEIGHEIIEMGVDIILGNHPHVSQPMEKYVYEKDGETKEGFIVYAFGNFVTYHPRSRNSSLAYTIKFDLAKGELDGETKTFIHNLKILPVYILNEKLPDGKYNCRILKFTNVLEDKKIDGKYKYGLTEWERGNLTHLNDVVLKKILLPKEYDEDLIYK